MRKDRVRDILYISKFAKVELASMDGNNLGNSLSGQRGFYFDEDMATVLYCDGAGNWSVAIKSDGTITSLKVPFEAIPERETYSVTTPGPSDAAMKKFVEYRDAEKKRVAEDKAKATPQTKEVSKNNGTTGGGSSAKDSPDAWKVFGDKAESVKSTWVKRSTKLKRLTTHANFKLWLTRNNITEKPENADTIISKLSAEIGEQAPATSPAPQATAAPADAAKPTEEKKDEKPAEAKPASPAEFTEREKRMAIALGAMGNEKLVGTKGIDFVREIPRINAMASFLGSWENMARVILKRNPSLGPSMPADLGKEGVMIDKDYTKANLKWFQATQATINAVYDSAQKSKGVISSIPGFTVQSEEPKAAAAAPAESKADDGHSKKSSYRSRSNRIGMIREIARS